MAFKLVLCSHISIHLDGEVLSYKVLGSSESVLACKKLMLLPSRRFFYTSLQ